MGITADIRQKIHEQLMDKEFTTDDFPEVQEKYGINKATIARNIARLVDKGHIDRIGYQEAQGRPRTVFQAAPGVSFAPIIPKPYKVPKSRTKVKTALISAEEKQQQAIMRLWETMDMPKVSDVVAKFSGFPGRTYQAIF